MSNVSIVIPRLDTKPWGGRRLTRYNLDLPAGPIGEALVTAGDAMVARGWGTGRSLDELVEEDPQGRSGALGLAAVHGKPIFPLLVKLIDASENLSIQVHPDDAGAKAALKLGKTEAWYVLAAEPDASLYIGLQEDIAIDSFAREAQRLDGSSSHLLRRVPAVPGETVLIPAGTIHALGAGVIVYEVQQPSDVTYRLDDWGRLDAAGRPRELHLEAGFAASRPELRPEIITPVDLGRDEVSWSLLVACRYFALAKMDLPAAATSRVGGGASATVVTLLEGDGTIGGEYLRAGETAVIWAGDSVTVHAQQSISALVAWVPDLDIDIIAPAQVLGVPNDAVESLAGDTGDITIGQVDP